MKLIASLTILASGLLLLTSSPASAHGAHHHDYRPPVRVERHRGYYVRRHEMPRWLRRDRAFRAWYQHSRYKYHRRLSWAAVYDIYLWDRRHVRRYRAWTDHDDYRDRRRGNGRRGY